MDEYKMLRDEMLLSYNRIQLNDNISYFITSAILAFALGTDNKNYFVCLIPLFVIIPLYFRTQASHRGIARLAAYMYVFLEGKDGMPMWERRHHTFDKNNNKGDWFYKCYSPLRYYMLVVICGVSAAVKFTETGNICPLLHFEIILFSCLIACGIIFWRCSNYTRLREKYIKQWEDVKKEEP